MKPLPSPRPNNETKLRRARLGLFCLFAAAVGLMGFRVIFPDKPFVYDFETAKKNLNTLLDPRDGEGRLLGDGKSPTGIIKADAAFKGEYSTLALRVTRDGDSPDLNGGTATIRKSFRAAFYPKADRPAGFPAGTLLMSGGRYALVQGDGSKVLFRSADDWRRIGLGEEAFLPVSGTEFALNPGEALWQPAAERDLPPGLLVKSDGIYYRMALDGNLERFVTEHAFLSFAPLSSALEIGRERIAGRTVSDQWLGFRDGSLLGFAGGVFMVNGLSIQPIGSPEVFLGLGFDWDDIIPVSEEEIALYDRGRIAIMDTPHPSGTVLEDADSGQAYLVSDAERLPITSPLVRARLLEGRHAIRFSEAALGVTETCSLEDGLFRRSHCRLPVERFSALPGNAFEITLSLPENAHLSRFSATFQSSVTLFNLRYALSQIKQRILGHYGFVENTPTTLP